MIMNEFYNCYSLRMYYCPPLFRSVTLCSQEYDRIRNGCCSAAKTKLQYASAVSADAFL